MVKGTVINIAKRYIKELPNEIDVKKAYLFGSHAKGRHSEESDIDIAIIIGTQKDIFEVQMQLLRLRREIDLRIEPHPIREEDFSTLNPFADEIMQSGFELV
ncbi:MAG: nucleotidyltransferase domain-containing protein [Bacteroidales bacterium]|nr:nucleotidyltransferase domain-containing protein [Bacteroidales bacterium]